MWRFDTGGRSIRLDPVRGRRGDVSGGENGIFALEGNDQGAAGGGALIGQAGDIAVRVLIA